MCAESTLRLYGLRLTEVYLGCARLDFSPLDTLARTLADVGLWLADSEHRADSEPYGNVCTYGRAGRTGIGVADL